MNVKETVAGFNKNWTHSLFRFPTNGTTSATVKELGVTYTFNSIISFILYSIYSFSYTRLRPWNGRNDFNWKHCRHKRKQHNIPIRKCEYSCIYLFIKRLCLYSEHFATTLSCKLFALICFSLKLSYFSLFAFFYLSNNSPIFLCLLFSHKMTCFISTFFNSSVYQNDV